MQDAQRSLVRALAAGAVTLSGAAAAAAGIAYHRLLRRPLPPTSGTLGVPGITGPLAIRRDRWGVAHVEGGNREDLWFGQGFLHAQDRLWQMDFYRHVASGRLAEIAGAEGLRPDRLMRTLGMRRAAEAEVGTLAPEVRGPAEAYCAGVNAGAAAAPAPPFELQVLRLEWQPWTVADILTVGKLLAFALSTNWERELLRADMLRELGEDLTIRLDPGYPRGNPVVMGGHWAGDGAGLAAQIGAAREAIGLAVDASGSNNWAVSAGRSATNGPLIAGDPHLPPSMPGIWYQLALRQGDRFARGASMPGMPGIYMGQGNDVVWTFTNVMADTQDLYVERIEGDRYLFRGEWRPLETRIEEIAVRGREPELLEVRSTHHGPIVNDIAGTDSGQPLALRWAALDEPTTTEAAFRIFDVRSGPELVEVMEHHTTPASNLVWADRHGSIGYKLVGRLPVREGGCPDLPKPGWTGDFEWAGTVPYAELPEVTDPQVGRVVTANNRIAGDDYPHHITSDWLDGYRALRIEQLLDEAEEHDLDDFERIQTDVLSIPGLEAARRLSRLKPEGQREQQAVEILRSWDGRLDPGSVAGAVYQAFILRLGREVARAAIGDRDLAERWLDRADNGFTAHVTSPWRWHSHLMSLWEEADDSLIGRPWDDLVLDSLRGGLDDLTDRFGTDPEGWAWGKVHEMEFPHALGGANPLFRRLLNRRLRVGGAQETVSQIAYDPNDPYMALWAPSWRMVADPLDPGRSRWVSFTGQSGHPASPHYDDLQTVWLEGRTIPMAGEGPWEELILEPA